MIYSLVVDRSNSLIHRCFFIEATSMGHDLLKWPK